VGNAREDLTILAIFHFILAGLCLLFSLIPVLYVVMGAAFVRGRLHGPNPPPEFFGWMLVTMGSVFMLLGLAFSAAVLYAGLSLRVNRRWTYCMVIAGLSCAWFPVGTVLGAFTIITLSRPEVRATFTETVATLPPVEQQEPAAASRQ
jgi:hypothetical protein